MLLDVVLDSFVNYGFLLTEQQQQAWIKFLSGKNNSEDLLQSTDVVRVYAASQQQATSLLLSFGNWKNSSEKAAR